MNEEEIQRTINAMRSMALRECVFKYPDEKHAYEEGMMVDWPGKCTWHVPSVEAVSTPELKCHRMDYMMLHTAWVEKSKEQLLFNRYMDRIAEVEVELHTNKSAWYVTVMEDFAKYIADLK